MFYYETLGPDTLRLLENLQSLPFLEQARLVGGTALALQIGHRKSVDLDFFGSISASAEEMKEALSANHTISSIKEAQNINMFLVDSVKVDFVNYRYNWIDDVVIEGYLRLASIMDIAAMKIYAIIGRGTKKDFIDLFFLLQRFSLEDILDYYVKKYPDGSLFMALKSLSYFDDAEGDPMPIMLEPVSWEQVKEAIGEEIRRI